jgi:hypothetical protein
MGLPIRRRTIARGVLGTRRSDPAEEEEKSVSKTEDEPRVLKAEKPDDGEVDVSDFKKRLRERKISKSEDVEDKEDILAKMSREQSDDELEELDHMEDGPIVERDKPVLRKKGTNPMADILENMRIGTVIVVYREDKSSWKVTVTDKFFTSLITPATTGARLKGKVFWEAVSNPEYRKWSSEWNQLTFSEKKKRAEKMGVSWQPSKNPRIEAMNVTRAVREHLGIKKYRDEYDSRAARANIKGH